MSRVWRNNISEFYCALVFLLMLAGCEKDETPRQSEKADVRTVRVVVLADDDEMTRWRQTAEWAVENLELAQRGYNERVNLELMYKSQNDDDIGEYMDQIAADTTIAAIIGPTTSPQAERMASKLNEAVMRHPDSKAYRKPMISPTASAVEYQRKFAKTDFVWNMTECDISRLEAVVSGFASKNMSQFISLTVIAPDEETEAGRQNSDTEWLSFLAEEYGIGVAEMLTYSSTAELRTVLENIDRDFSLISNQLVFTPACAKDIRVMNEYLCRSVENNEQAYPTSPHLRVYCLGNFVSPASEEILSVNSSVCYEGLDICPAPESGFRQAYRQHFGDEILDGEAQLYDAVCMVAFGTALSLDAGITLNEALQSMNRGEEGVVMPACYPNGMSSVFEAVRGGHCPAISGACGEWCFKDGSTSITGTTYRHWRYYKGKFLTLEYISSTGSRRSTSSEHVWDWTANHRDDFGPDADAEISYPELADNWALLVAASKGWPNYRFQADVFSIYDILKDNGYDDDHIVLIVEDDLAFNGDNKNDRGAVRTSENGPNLYVPGAIDYKLGYLQPSDIGDILQGRSSDRLPEVIKADAHDNIFVFWSSHGNPGALDFGGVQTMWYTQMRDIIEQTPHRKLLMAVEACYSGGLGETCTGLPGVLLLTAASPFETSHADVWSQKIGVYLSNGFTAGFQKAIAANPAISMNHLYYELASSTTGSHAKVYNIANYGSIYSNSMSEYLHR